MYEELEPEKYRAEPPSLLNALTELPRTLVEVGSLAMTMPVLASLPRGDGHPVLVLPGFMAGDESTLVLRRYLQMMGYSPVGWQLGRNTGRREIIEQTLISRFEELSAKYKQKISLIGQSLGGVYGRELGRLFPGQVRQIITLGSPFSMTSASATNPLVRKLFENQSGGNVDEMRRLMSQKRSSQTPITAIYSRGDGVVNWRGCIELEPDSNAENIEVCGSHCGMAFNPSIYRIIADRLAQPEGAWARYDKSTFGSMFG